MKLGILRTDTVRPEWSARFGEYPDMFMRLLGRLDPSLEFRVYHVERQEYPDDIDEVDAYLITGSKFSVYDDEPWIYRLADFVRELHARRKTMIGICFGHQMIAHALGGETRKSHRGWGVGLHRHRLHGRPDWSDDGDAQFRILVSHQDQVERVAPGTEVLAGSDFCENAVCQIGDHILTFQGHPEFEPDYAREIMQLRRETIGEETYQAGMDSLDEQPETERIGRWLLAFLHKRDRAVA
ncbi:glutamine amidotransferase-related protein [Chromatocurvus halotolerans]|uniref:GMP synthase-like glutamine amidotransferase n=1 Tax=Chromatocurvus halotolerans TaxID=1132028 RepID=A0A4V6NPB7_9GAMM|nr:GMP synthase [Chromatocurvus halotolerans]TCO73220.1 GMP synthase-like glutamine amidotransferase [Chromatocurvus halotolerans]